MPRRQRAWTFGWSAVDLRFPLNLLVRGVEVIQAPDTLLSLGSLNVSVQALPLFKGRVEVDDITLSKVKVNSSEPHQRHAGARRSGAVCFQKPRHRSVQ